MSPARWGKLAILSVFHSCLMLNCALWKSPKSYLNLDGWEACFVKTDASFFFGSYSFLCSDLLMAWMFCLKTKDLLPPVDVAVVWGQVAEVRSMVVSPIWDGGNLQLSRNDHLLATIRWMPGRAERRGKGRGIFKNSICNRAHFIHIWF